MNQHSKIFAVLMLIAVPLWIFRALTWRTGRPDPLDDPEPVTSEIGECPCMHCEAERKYKEEQSG
jgi:hypothetical protein